MPPEQAPHMVDVGAAGDLARRVDRLVERSDVGLQAPVALLRRRVAPADGEGLHAAARAAKRIRLLSGRQVERVDTC